MPETDNATIMSGTGLGRAEFFESMANRGRMAAPAAQNFRLACLQVLSTVFDEEWGQVDLKTDDLDDIWERFVNKKAGSLSNGSFSA